MSQANPVQVQKFLGSMNYPASKNEIVRCTEQNDADDNVLDVLRRIPERQYDDPNAVSHEISEAQ